MSAGSTGRVGPSGVQRGWAALTLVLLVLFLVALIVAVVRNPAACAAAITSSH